MVSTGSPRAWYDDDSNGSGEDWPAQMADSIERVVGSVRDKTTGPALTIARAIVYGTFAAIVAVLAIVIFVMAVILFLNAYLPDSIFGKTHDWAVYLLLGLLFTGSGIFLWSRRRLPSRQAEHAATR